MTPIGSVLTEFELIVENTMSSNRRAFMMTRHSLQPARIVLAASFVLLSAATQTRSPQPTALDAAAVATSAALAP